MLLTNYTVYEQQTVNTLNMEHSSKQKFTKHHSRV